MTRMVAWTIEPGQHTEVLPQLAKSRGGEADILACRAQLKGQFRDALPARNTARLLRA